VAGSADLVEALCERDPERIAGTLAGGVVFNSPVATYHGREDVAHVLATAADVLDDLSVKRRMSRPPEEVVFVSARIAGKDVDGVLDQVVDRDGLVAEVTLMLRPLSALLSGVKRMGAALEDRPLPSGRTGG
jgi:hypothetical protein